MIPVALKNGKNELNLQQETRQPIVELYKKQFIYETDILIKLLKKSHAGWAVLQQGCNPMAQKQNNSIIILTCAMLLS